jgi:hypothetical protein
MLLKVVYLPPTRGDELIVLETAMFMTWYDGFGTIAIISHQPPITNRKDIVG